MRRVGLVRTTRGSQLLTASPHARVTHAHDGLNLVVGAGIVNHDHEIHVLLGIEQAGIRVFFVTPEFEHVNTVGEKCP